MTVEYYLTTTRVGQNSRKPTCFGSSTTYWCAGTLGSPCRRVRVGSELYPTLDKKLTIHHEGMSTVQRRVLWTQNFNSWRMTLNDICDVTLKVSRRSWYCKRSNTPGSSFYRT